MKKIFLLIGCCAFMLACNNQPDDSKEAAEETNEAVLQKTDLEDDAEFAVDAADGGMLEVTLGELAAKNAASPMVKEFAAMMVTDHSNGNEELKALAMQKNITLPAALSESKQKKVDDLTKLNGAEFDKEYMAFMVEDHKEDIREFEKQAQNGNDADLKQWASNKVAVLQKHLAEAERIKDAIK